MLIPRIFLDGLKRIKFFIDLELNFNYSKSFRFGFRDGSLDKKPKIKRETKNTIVVYTKIFNVNIKRLIHCR
jgi:hypothetical protein